MFFEWKIFHNYAGKFELVIHLNGLKWKKSYLNFIYDFNNRN